MICLKPIGQNWNEINAEMSQKRGGEQKVNEIVRL